jgi:glycosyltransferase involved in cell wall biosynthesis
MACGLPIVAHKSGGYTDWVTPGENGYIFSTQEEAFQTLNILRNDADLLQRLSSGARESAERIAGHEACRAYFSWLTGIST